MTLKPTINNTDKNEDDYITAIAAENMLPEQQTGILFLHGDTGIKWNPDDEQHSYLYNRVKKLNGNWNGIFWNLNTTENLKKFLEFSNQKKKIRSYEIMPVNSQFTGTVIKVVRLNDDAGYFYHDNPEIARAELKHTWVTNSSLNASQWWLNSPTLISSNIDQVLNEYMEKGATIEFINKTSLPITVSKLGRVTQLSCNPIVDPSHYLLRERLDKT
ncbi:hypothetical protein [Alkalimarinus alittae]|uniref:Uncharacterized protein n=1 Tax=Alkalimarinus alittae TaxID=2961619 RepID=A0ABY6N7B8_9ALTE|nr:hypothetical protein [Alkalimarinus alittae]UZE97915.1 hypothetical protein NKI27_09335 [Alkalimarinus alittae]